MTGEHSPNVVDVSSITVLINRARDGCDASRSRVLSRLEPFLISMAARHADTSLRSKESVSDIVQRSFLKILEKFDSFEGTSSAEFRGWLKVLVVNEVRQIQRKWHRGRRDVQRERSLEHVNPGNSATGQDEPKPAGDLILGEQLESLSVHLDRLNETQREVIHLRMSEGLTFPQIAGRMNRTADAVSKIWYRSLIQLQKFMANDEIR